MPSASLLQQEPDEATQAAQAVAAHRADAARLRTRVEEELAALREEVSHRAQLQAQIRAWTAEDRNGRRRAALLRRVSVEAHAGRLARLTRELRQAIALEPFEQPAQAAKAGTATATAAAAPATAAGQRSKAFDDLLTRFKARLASSP